MRLRDGLFVLALSATPGCRCGAASPTVAAANRGDAPTPLVPVPVDVAPREPGPAARTRPHAQIPTRCRKSIRDFCGDRCPTYEAARQQALRAKTDYRDETCTGLGSGDVVIGTCGGLRFVEDGDCLSGMTHYFDAADKLVGVYAWSDVRRECGSSTVYGLLPTCGD